MEVLQRGEILSEDMDIEAELELISQDKLSDLDLSAAGGIAPDEEEQSDGGDESEEQNSEIREEVIRRLKSCRER